MIVKSKLKSKYSGLGWHGLSRLAKLGAFARQTSNACTVAQLFPDGLANKWPHSSQGYLSKQFQFWISIGFRSHFWFTKNLTYIPRSTLGRLCPGQFSYNVSTGRVVCLELDGIICISCLLDKIHFVRVTLLLVLSLPATSPQQLQRKNDSILNLSRFEIRLIFICCACLEIWKENILPLFHVL